MTHNVITKMTLNVNKQSDYNNILKEMFDTDDYIYSYIVFNKEDKYVVNFYISENEKYNRIKCRNVYKDIVDKIKNNSGDKILTFGQPDLELMLKMYYPYVVKLSKHHYSKWSTKFEYEDLLQIGFLTMIKLYKQGYYLNKYLIARSFQNEVYIELRKDKNAPIIVNLDDTFCDAKDSELKYVDIIADTSPNCEELITNSDYTNKVFSDIKEIIVTRYGPRRFEQLLNDYGNKRTTQDTRLLLRNVKKLLASKQITIETFDKYK